MHSRAVLIHYSPRGRPIPETIAVFAAEHGLGVVSVPRGDEVLAVVNRSLPACLILDADGESAESLELCRTLKSDTFTAIVPVVLYASGGGDTLIEAGLEVGADEVLGERMNERERFLRFQRTLHRAARDLGVNPTTRLPGTAQIERDIAERLRRGEIFAVCYADLDHFKEFNDRYGYNEGDRVILMLSRILRDIVRAYAPTGFIGHIGGDDFIFNVPIEQMTRCCEEILEIFDELAPYQYNEEDRRAGYFLGKDRRGVLHRIPLMTLSIGVATNENRHYTHTARMSEVATEMKVYAKSFPGSVYAVDRRSDGPACAGEPVVAAVEVRGERVR